jgi:hypothetical protein
MSEHAERPEARMNWLRRRWPDLVIIVGITWLSFACSAFAGDGNIEGQIDRDGGDVAGDFSIGYTPTERLSVAAASALTALGLLGKFNQRRSEPPPPARESQPPGAPQAHE